MAELNKYGEIEETTCSGCGNLIKTEWVACPQCGENLKERNNEKIVKQELSLQEKFMCPFCGKTVKLADGVVFRCRLCNAHGILVGSTWCLGRN